MPGPKRTPRHLRLLRGTLKPSRDDTGATGLPPVNTLPPVPTWLSLPAAADFKRLAAILKSARMLSAGTPELLAAYCALQAKLAEAWKRDELPNAAHLNVLRTLAGALGLTALNVRPAAEAAAPNRFTKNLETAARERRP